MSTNESLENIDYNLWYGFTNGYDWADTKAGSNSIVDKIGNPEDIFSDVLNNDFHLKPGSPVIDVGTAVSGFNYDIEGTSRPQDGDGINGAEWDIGTYEYVQ